MREILLDILNHTLNLGFIDELKITGTAETTLIETMDEQQRVVIKGTLKQPVDQFIGEFGITNLPELKGIVDFVNFKADGAVIKVARQERDNGDIVPDKIVFTDEQGQSAWHRFCVPEYIREQFDFIGADWSVVFNISKSKLAELSHFAGVFSDSLFTVKTVDGELRFYIGGDNGAFLKIPTYEDVDFKSDMQWHTSEVISVLKLDDNNAEVSIFNDPRAGVLQIKVETDYANWLYIFPLVNA